MSGKSSKKKEGDKRSLGALFVNCEQECTVSEERGEIISLKKENDDKLSVWDFPGSCFAPLPGTSLRLRKDQRIQSGSFADLLYYVLSSGANEQVS